MAVLSVHAGVALSAGWTNVSNGLTGSVPVVTGLVIDRSTGSTLYALTSGAILWSTDAGASWKAIGNIANVTALALDPTSASMIYAGTAQGVMKSTDAGGSWVSAGLSGTSINVLAIDPMTPSTIYAGANGHLYKSTDRGGNWTDLNLGAPAAADGLWIAGLVLDPSAPSTLYVALGIGAGGNLIKSVDGGATWNVIQANAGPFYNTPSNLVIDPSTPSTLYRINPLKKSTDGGITWTATGFTDFAAALAVDPRNSNILYVSSVGKTGYAILKSTDGGQSWNAVNTIIPALSFVLSPDANTIYAVTGGGLFKSTDGGLDWGEIQIGPSVFDIKVLVGDPVDSATVYAGGNDGLFKSVDRGGSWTRLPAPGASVRSLLINFTNPNILYLGTARPEGCFSADIPLHKSTNGGATWDDSISPYAPFGNCDLSIDAMIMDPLDANTLYLPYGDDWVGFFTVLKTTDGGAHWEDLGTAGLGAASEVNALEIDPHTPAILYAATDIGVFRSTDGGTSFTPAGLANTVVGHLAIDPVRSNVLYGTVSGNVYKSVDSGANWSPINQGLDEIVAAQAPVNGLLVDSDRPNILYLATSGYGVFESTNGGGNWAPFNDGLTYVDVQSLALVLPGKEPYPGDRPGAIGPSILYAGTPGGVFKIQ